MVKSESERERERESSRSCYGKREGQEVESGSAASIE
jgi:hypothetical protein